MRHRTRDELRKIAMGDQRSRLVEDHDGAILSRPLGLDEIAEGVELEIGGEHAWHLSPQGCADRDHRGANAEGEIGRRDIRTVRSHCLPIPGAFAGVVSVLPQIDFIDLVALSIPKKDRKSTRLNSSHVAISYAVFCL